MSEENKNSYVSYWLLLITSLVAIMIIIGGLTRLTDSGLSITKWDLFSGILPPLTAENWERYFSLYKKIPQYKLLNSSMNIDQFKTIYWWEYIHRLLGRIIGLLYLIPLVFFTFKNFIKKDTIIYFYVILFLIIFQGFIGWYMVKSGLSERTDVSHYRLASHLMLAFVIYIMLFWNYLKYSKAEKFIHNKKLPAYIPIFFLFCLLIQICFGAFLSGLDAGQIYQSWPLMNDTYFPDDSKINDLFSINVFDNPSIVQFLHRNLAYLLILAFIFIVIKIYRNNDFMYLKNITFLIFVILVLQIILGIFTVLSGAMIYLASMHQIGSIFLISSTLVLIFKSTKIN